MFTKFNLFELLNDGFSEIRVSSNLFFSIVLHFIIPIFLTLLFIFFNIRFDNEIISNIISSISIFSGLLFSVIFIVTENYLKRKHSLLNNSNEEAKRYINRYKDFAKHTTTLILFSVAIAVISIIFLLLYLFIIKGNITQNQLFSDFFQQNNVDCVAFKNTILNILQLISSIFLFNYLLSVIVLIKEVYAMIFEFINFDME